MNMIWKKPELSKTFVKISDVSLLTEKLRFGSVVFIETMVQFVQSKCAESFCFGNKHTVFTFISNQNYLLIFIYGSHFCLNIKKLFQTSKLLKCSIAFYFTNRTESLFWPFPFSFLTANRTVQITDITFLVHVGSSNRSALKRKQIYRFSRKTENRAEPI